VGNSTQHRILATLRAAYNVAVRRPGMIDWNPCLAVELPPEVNEPGRVWSPEQVVTFLESSAEDRLALLYRIILLRGLRRGEACGIRHEDLDDDDSGVEIVQTILDLSGKVVFDTPKSRAGGRHVSLDSETRAQVKMHRRRQRREKLAAGGAYQDHGLFFCREDGTPLHPSWVTQHFHDLSEAAGLPRIRLHDGRHTAATLAFEAGTEIKAVSQQLGHSGTGITQDLYTHVRRAVHDHAAEQVLTILPDRRKETR
jgi:integrase